MTRHAINTPVDTGITIDIHHIKVGMTTKAELVELFGQPDFTGVDADGLLQWTWTHLGVEVKAGKDASITSFFNLEVSFEGDLVSSYSYSRKAE